MSQHPLTDITFESFDLHPHVLSGLHATGFMRCTPIQALALPVALSGRDVAGQAQTGTGKTAAFLVAVLNRLLTQPAMTDRKLTDPRAIIVAPTRELAIQIDKDFHAIGRDTGLTSALIYGGVDYDKQREALKSGCDLVIATPGRLIDYLKQHVFTLNAIEVVVIDEADRMFDLGFIKDIRFLLRRMPPREQRQGMLFSATLSLRVLELAYEHMNSPEKVTAETDTVTADHVHQVVYFPAKEEKLPLLINLLSRIEAPRGIVFVNTKIAAEKVTRTLERQGFTVAALSGDVPQAKRERLLARFQKGDIELLVATDVAARGLHIAAVSHVFNYDLPHDPEDYVHRIGRTARLGAEGDAISFACDLYAIGLPDIERYIDQKIPTAAIDAELLAPRPPRARAKPLLTSDEDNAADDARNTAGAPPKTAPSPRSRAPRAGSTRGAAHGADHGRDPRVQVSRESHAGLPNTRVVLASSAPPAAEGARPVEPGHAIAATDPMAPRKRRRRGGRGRSHREAGETTDQVAAASGSGTANGATDAALPRSRPERKPHRDNAIRGPHSTTRPNPAAAPAATPPAATRQGFFRRIAKMFSAH